MFEEAGLLRERAVEFLRSAERLYSEGSYDLAAFSLEQHCQLLLKYGLLLKTGSYPRPHSLTRLVGELSKLEPKVKQLLTEANILWLARLEDAYVGARYLPRRYVEVEVREMLRFVREVFDRVVGEV